MVSYVICDAESEKQYGFTTGVFIEAEIHKSGVAL